MIIYNQIHKYSIKILKIYIFQIMINFILLKKYKFNHKNNYNLNKKNINLIKKLQKLKILKKYN